MKKGTFISSTLLCFIAVLLLLSLNALNLLAQVSLNNTKVDGYRGIWFELNQKSKYGDKYSGGLGTYTAKHNPLAIYASEVDKTFFVYGGTISANEKYLLCMIGEFDHKSGMVSLPTVVHDKQGVDDPHDNPSLMIDDDGYLWVFVSGRNTRRLGFKYRSKKPYNIDAFEQVSEEIFTYPQIWKTDEGFFHLFTKYTGVRQLYFETSTDGLEWSDDKQLAAIPQNEGEKSGHYQLSYCHEGKLIGTFFNRHINGHPDTRTDLYYLQTKDLGKTWTDVRGNAIEIPLQNMNVSARVIDYHSLGKNVYMKDMGYDNGGNPVCLYIRSNGYLPGPDSAPYEWCVSKWTGEKWQTTVITTSDHNYDMGSLFIEKQTWKVVGPTQIGPQEYGAGGELVIWESKNEGESWKKSIEVTAKSKMNHGYVRRPLNYKSPFCFFWADGDPHQFSRSTLYFGDFEGNVWQLPYNMGQKYVKPLTIK